MLRDEILGGFPRPVDPEAKVIGQPGSGSMTIEMTPEKGLRLSGLIQTPPAANRVPIGAARDNRVARSRPNPAHSSRCRLRRAHGCKRVI